MGVLWAVSIVEMQCGVRGGGGGSGVKLSRCLCITDLFFWYPVLGG